MTSLFATVRRGGTMSGLNESLPQPTATGEGAPEAVLP